MSDFIRIASISDLPDPGKQLLEVDDRLVVLFHVQGQFYCIEDLCTHDGGTLADGDLDGTAIACPRHGAKFDIRNGKVISMPATEDTIYHQVKVEGNDVFVRLSDE
ncbi:MAG: non-heme iron oxygenase ferredoxin subunit [Pirellulaceae bacterium]